jgi:hypothetical protein
MLEVNRSVSTFAFACDDRPFGLAIPQMAHQAIETKCEPEIAAYFLNDRQR